MSHPTHEHDHHDPHAHLKPAGGHDTTYEGTDATVGIVLGSLGVIFLTLVVVAIITFPIQNLLKAANPPGNLPSPLAKERVTPPAPYIQVQPWVVFPELKAKQDAVLAQGGKDATGQQHIPIDQAVQSVVSQLKIRPNSPQGLTTPGGIGRDFAGSVNSMPPQYRTQTPGPTIQGEIQKNAQK